MLKNLRKLRNAATLAGALTLATATAAFAGEPARPLPQPTQECTVDPVKILRVDYDNGTQKGNWRAELGWKGTQGKVLSSGGDPQLEEGASYDVTLDSLGDFVRVQSDERKPWVRTRLRDTDGLANRVARVLPGTEPLWSQDLVVGYKDLREQGVTEVEVPLITECFYKTADGRERVGKSGGFAYNLKVRIPEQTVEEPLLQVPQQPPANGPPRCSDGKDNDKDGFVDYPEDPNCKSPNDNREGHFFWWNNPYRKIERQERREQNITIYNTTKVKQKIVNQGNGRPQRDRQSRQDLERRVQPPTKIVFEDDLLPNDRLDLNLFAGGFNLSQGDDETRYSFDGSKVGAGIDYSRRNFRIEAYGVSSSGSDPLLEDPSFEETIDASVFGARLVASAGDWPVRPYVEAGGEYERTQVRLGAYGPKTFDDDTTRLQGGVGLLAGDLRESHLMIGARYVTEARNQTDLAPDFFTSVQEDTPGLHGEFRIGMGGRVNGKPRFEFFGNGNYFEPTTVFSNRLDQTIEEKGETWNADLGLGTWFFREKPLHFGVALSGGIDRELTPYLQGSPDAPFDDFTSANDLNRQGTEYRFAFKIGW